VKLLVCASPCCRVAARLPIRLEHRRRTAEDDEIFENNGIKLFVDQFSGQYLDGVEIDYVSTMMGAGFTFKESERDGGCGCGSSFTA
jgi:iron-sulfur cluster assembly accessory protein